MKASRWQGNHPEANHQFYSDEDTLDQFGRLTRVYTSLANYTRAAVAANSEAGTPVMRPLFLMFEDDPMAHQQDYECAGSQIFSKLKIQIFSGTCSATTCWWRPCWSPGCPSGLSTCPARLRRCGISIS